MTTVRLVTIATGKYQMFLPRLLSSAQRHLVGYDGAFVLSDKPLDPVLVDLGATHLPWGHLPWPYPTLLRFRAITAYGDLIEGSADAVMYVDADMAFVRSVDVGAPSGLVAVQHPGFVGSPAADLPFETDPRCYAYVAPGESDRYVAGGFQGGHPAAYVGAAREMAARIQTDLEQGIVPVWHDESVWNRYTIDHPPERVLDASYCWPEEKPYPEARLLALAKDHNAVRDVPWRDRARQQVATYRRRGRNLAVRVAKRVLRRGQR